MNAMNKPLLSTITFALLVAHAGATDLFDPVNLRQAQGVVVGLYNEDTGVRYAKIHYEKFSKKPTRIGFLKVGFPILTFHELSMHLVAKHANARSLLTAIEQTANARSSRYLFGENVTLAITDGKGDPIKVRARKAKFCPKGLRFFGEVELLLPGKKMPFLCDSLYLKAEQDTNCLTLVTSTGNAFAPIALGDDSKRVSQSTAAANKTQGK